MQASEARVVMASKLVMGVKVKRSLSISVLAVNMTEPSSITASASGTSLSNYATIIISIQVVTRPTVRPLSS
jgi:hypothetical protein